MADGSNEYSFSQAFNALCGWIHEQNTAVPVDEVIVGFLRTAKFSFHNDMQQNLKMSLDTLGYATAAWILSY